MLKIVLARHAETIWNEELRYIGRTDLDLSPLGRSNAGLLAAHLNGASFDVIYTSAMKRARQTAEPIARTQKIEPQTESRLNEIDFGYWEGLTHDEISAAYPDLVDQWISDPFAVDIPGGEPWPLFAERVERGWAGIVETDRPDRARNILIVTHAGCIKTILGRMMGLDAKSWWQIYQDKGALNHVVVDQGSARVIRINDTDYRCPPEAGQPPATFLV